MSVTLGPGIVEEIFDGIQRPLKVIAEEFKSIYIPRGVEVPILNETKLWPFKPVKKVYIKIICNSALYYTVLDNLRPKMVEYVICTKINT